MKVIKREKKGVTLRLGGGEELLTSLGAFCEKEKIKGAWFLALGAADELKLAFYDLNKKRYISRDFRGRFEILNITGNIGRKNGKVLLHAHGTFSRPNFSTFGGHILHCRISATCEIYLQKVAPLSRKIDPKTGLNLLV